MEAAEPHQSKGLLASLCGLGATLIAMMHTRLALLGVDLEEDARHLFLIAKLTLITLFCFGLAVVLLTILISVIFWDNHRILVLSLLTGFFLLSGIVIGQYTHKKIKQKPTFFSSSVTELVKDWQSLDIHAKDVS